MVNKKTKIIFLLVFWGGLVVTILGTGFLFKYVSNGGFGKLPTFDQLENPPTNLATEVYSADTKLLGKYYSENRSNIKYENLPKNLIDALTATEDIRFRGHSGIDLRGLGRVLKGVLTFDLQGGGSTISQQLAKNLFNPPTGGLIERIKQKLKEWVIAVRLESRYTKDEIMVMYLNTVTFGNNSFGIKSATRTYFNKPVDSLIIQESAVLVGMLKAPSTYNPARKDNKKSFHRRNTVLGQMRNYGYLEPAKCDSLQALPIELNFVRSSHVEGLAPYFREYLRGWVKQWARNNLKLDSTRWDVYSDGLRIYTTIDSRMQAYAEESVEEHLVWLQEKFDGKNKGRNMWKGGDAKDTKTYQTSLKQAIRNSVYYKDFRAEGYDTDSVEILMNTPTGLTIFTNEGEKDTVMKPVDAVKWHRKVLQSGFLAVDPASGEIKAWVGGRDYKYFQYDHVTSRRQVGSTFKPLLYAQAIKEGGYSPCYKIYDLPTTFEDFDNYTPQNAGRDGFTGDLWSLKACLADSRNSCAAYLMKEIGPQPVIDLARKLGIRSHIDPYPAIALGTADISLMEMVGAYTAFANKGFYTEPIFVSRIEDKNGNIIYEGVPEKREALDEQTAYIMVDMLRGVTMSGGTAVRLRSPRYYALTGDMGGKTGTTQNHSDGWFMGITPDLVAGAWTGGEDRFMRFRSLEYGQGARMAMPIWGLFFQKLYADKELGYDMDKKFEKPKSRMTIELDCSKYELQSSQDRVPSDYGPNNGWE